MLCIRELLNTQSDSIRAKLFVSLQSLFSCDLINFATLCTLYCISICNAKANLPIHLTMRSKQCLLILLIFVLKVVTQALFDQKTIFFS